MKIVIAGGRDFNNYSVLKSCLDSMRQEVQINEIVSGNARGADELGETWAKANYIPIKLFPADWDRYGANAGFIRNAQMGEYADGLLAFWDGNSKGTAHMIKTMKFANKPYVVFNYNGDKIMEGGCLDGKYCNLACSG